ncbi:hypothetical protein LAZ67_X003371 [Cordylochernes scorpioides]|uniref:CCHC-type domain-containing protein n=1 Tax=Cordylochernes scorpioides TaxID=51811 RepID=A0ABY6LU40_9ARAC|nr:hypothetical protein LAZ67_X003371 [Cordylochernes scorpioides]
MFVSPQSSSNAIYRIPCNDCSQSYVGETGRTIATRVLEHERNIRSHDQDNMVISRHYQILQSLGQPSIAALHLDLVRFIEQRTEKFKCLVRDVKNLAGTVNDFMELDEIMDAQMPKKTCQTTQTSPAPTCRDSSAQTEPIKPATPPLHLLSLKQPEASNPPAKRTEPLVPAKPASSRAPKPAVAKGTLNGEKSAAHIVVIADNPQDDPRDILKAVRAAHTLPQGVSAHQGKLVMPSSTPEAIPAVSSALDNRLQGLKAFLSTDALSQLPGDKSVRVTHRFPTKNGTCTAFIELDLASYKAIGRRGRIIVNQGILNYEESVRVRVCYRCCGYGHNADRCTKATVTCFHCASGDHQGRSCPTLANPRTAKCANYSAKGLSADHEARSLSCPTARSRAAKFYLSRLVIVVLYIRLYAAIKAQKSFILVISPVNKDIFSFPLAGQQASQPSVDIAALVEEDNMVISRHYQILQSLGQPSLTALHLGLVRFIEQWTEIIKCLVRDVKNLEGIVNDFLELDEIMAAQMPKKTCQTGPAPTCRDLALRPSPSSLPPPPQLVLLWQHLLPKSHILL